MLKKLFKKKVTIDPIEELAKWEASGKPLPPPHIVKQRTIAEYQSRYGPQTLVETGTYLGDMVEAQKNNFSRIYSIELSTKLYAKAQKRFKGNDKVNLLQGDSGKKLTEVINQLTQVALFWLDGHYSGGITALGDKECPVPEELETILKSDLKHIILIDDARLFNGTNDYPAIREIKEIVAKHKKNYDIQVKDDIIRMIPLN